VTRIWTTCPQSSYVSESQPLVHCESDTEPAVFHMSVYCQQRSRAIATQKLIHSYVAAKVLVFRRPSLQQVTLHITYLLTTSLSSLWLHYWIVNISQLNRLLHTLRRLKWPTFRISFGLICLQLRMPLKFTLKLRRQVFSLAFFVSVFSSCPLSYCHLVGRCCGLMYPSQLIYKLMTLKTVAAGVLRS